MNTRETQTAAPAKSPPHGGRRTLPPAAVLLSSSYDIKIIFLYGHMKEKKSWEC